MGIGDPIGGLLLMLPAVRQREARALYRDRVAARERETPVNRGGVVLPGPDRPGAERVEFEAFVQGGGPTAAEEVAVAVCGEMGAVEDQGQSARQRQVRLGQRHLARRECATCRGRVLDLSVASRFRPAPRRRFGWFIATLRQKVVAG